MRGGRAAYELSGVGVGVEARVVARKRQGACPRARARPGEALADERHHNPARPGIPTSPSGYRAAMAPGTQRPAAEAGGRRPVGPAAEGLPGNGPRCRRE